MKLSPFSRLLYVAVFVIGISLLHYLTPLRLPMLHDVFQRLYYIPIILAGFWFGLRGGICSAVAVSIIYAPHLLYQWGAHMSMDLEKYLEIVLYNVVGGVTGFLSQRERKQSQQLRETAKGLEVSYEKLRLQSDLIIEIEGQLREAERLSTIGELSAALAHEIRNPLGSIKGTAEILMDDFRPADKKYEFLQILVKESDRLNRVVEDFLRLARPQPVIMQECDVAGELRTIITLVSAEARKREVHLGFATEVLPPIDGDPEKLRQAFLNIILNALQATPPKGGILISASVKAGENSTPSVEVRFVDTGEGIPPEVMERIFEPFFTTREGGTGLGMAITRKIIEAHGGSIAVESEVGGGTTFTVRLPAKTTDGKQT